MALEAEPHTAALSDATAKNIRRIAQLWNGLLERSGGPYLLGDWSIADAFFAPVATRFRTYGVHLGDYGDPGKAGEYCARLLAWPDFLEWEKVALAEA